MFTLRLPEERRRALGPKLSRMLRQRGLDSHPALFSAGSWRPAVCVEEELDVQEPLANRPEQHRAQPGRAPLPRARCSRSPGHRQQLLPAAQLTRAREIRVPQGLTSLPTTSFVSTTGVRTERGVGQEKAFYVESEVNGTPTGAATCVST